MPAPGSPGGALPLDGFFGLHPSLTFLQQCYAARELVVLHAVASPYRERSHFDGQDVLESGLRARACEQTGWLNRALAELPERRARRAGRCAGPERAAGHARAGRGHLVVALEAAGAG